MFLTGHTRFTLNCEISLLLLRCPSQATQGKEGTRMLPPASPHRASPAVGGGGPALRPFPSALLFSSPPLPSPLAPTVPGTSRRLVPLPPAFAGSSAAGLGSALPQYRSLTSRSRASVSGCCRGATAWGHFGLGGVRRLWLAAGWGWGAFPSLAPPLRSPRSAGSGRWGCCGVPGCPCHRVVCVVVCLRLVTKIFK